MSTSIVTANNPENLPLCERPGSLIDVQSPIFETFLMLWTSYKLRRPGPGDPMQDVEISNRIWTMIERERIPLDLAMKFVDSLPKVKPRAERVLEDWWNSQKGDVCNKIG